VTPSLFLLLFAGIPTQQPLPLGEDFSNYHLAHDMAREHRKPLLIIMNPGPQSQDGALTLEKLRQTRERRRLLKDYVVVVIDTSTRHGKIVHKAYKRPKLPYVVVLGKRQRYQIFTTGEKLYGQRWTEILKTYRDGVRVAPKRAAAFCST